MKVFRLDKKLMGTRFELILHHPNEKEAEQLLQLAVSEIERIEALLSEFRENTVTSELNKNAGIKPVRTGEEVYDLIRRCKLLSDITDGAFDITVGPLKKIYQFKNNNFVFPDSEAIQDALKRVGFRYIQMMETDQSVILEQTEMTLSFAAIGKGYAADRVKKMWLSKGVSSAVISASGDMSTIGKSSSGSPWKIGIADPDNQNKTLLYIPVENASVATSGDYEQYFLYNGIRYSHNINPLNGLPISGIKSVTVVSPAAELSDALATAVTVMGVEKGIDFINKLPDTHCLIITNNNKVHGSKDINIEYEN